MSITFEQVSFSYNPLSKRQIKAGETPKYALKNVSFSLEDGEFLAIAGHTGSGKSTLTQHLTGLVHPTEGRVLWKGKDLANKKTAIEARGDIGLVFQYPEHQLFAASVYEDVAFGPRNLGLSSREVEERVREALDQVNLSFDELRDVSPFELSGGALAETPFFENERRHQLYDALAKLKPEYREALYLVYFEDMSYHMAAQVMNKNERQITNLIYRGKQSLKAILEKEGFQYADK